MGVHTAILLLPKELEDIEKAMTEWLKRHCRLRVCTRRLPPRPTSGEQLAAWIAETFNEIAGWIEEKATQAGGPKALRDFAVYISAADPDIMSLDDFQPLESGSGGRMSLIWMLVLAFPEVHWVFFSPYSPPTTELFTSETTRKRFISAHIYTEDGKNQLWDLQKAGYTSLFDPGGIRELMRKNLRSSEINKEKPYKDLPQRSLEAIALDEEPEYAFFTAYLAYRFGFRSWSLSSMEMMKWRLKESDPDCLALSLEDVFLSFPDRSYEMRLSDLELRYQEFPALTNVKHRVLITVGRKLGESGGITSFQNQAFLKRLGGSFRILYKPLTGIFETAYIANIKKVITWPPIKARNMHSISRSHSAPGRVLAIAGILLARAQNLLLSSPSVQDAIQAGVLALEAKELVGGQTPTLALRAIALQQEAEIIAESLFLGVQHNLNVRQRLREIKTEVEFVGRWVHPSQKKRAALNARLSIAEQLAKRYHDLNQIEEESACLAEARRLRFDFWVLEKRIRWILWPLLRYFAFSLSSIPRFILAVAFWTLFFGISYYLFGIAAGKPDVYFADAMMSAAKLFLTGNGSSNWETLRSVNTDGWEVFWKAWVTLQSMISFINLGLLISHLYMIVSRR